jgi:hypothetical protein
MEDLSQFSQFGLMDSYERSSNTVYSYTPSFDSREACILSPSHVHPSELSESLFVVSMITLYVLIQCLTRRIFPCHGASSVVNEVSVPRGQPSSVVNEVSVPRGDATTGGNGGLPSDKICSNSSIAPIPTLCWQNF